MNPDKLELASSFKSASEADAAAVLARHFSDTNFECIPGELVPSLKLRLLDTLGCMLAGSGAPGCPELVGLCRTWSGAPQSRVIGQGQRLPAPLAALANGAMARAVDFDDVFEPGTLHVSASLLPAALAVAEAQGGVSGESFLTALALGSDLICRLSLAILLPPGISGMNSSFQCAYFAAAGVAGKLMGLDRDGLQNALGLAYTQLAGNSQNLLEGTLAIRLSQGLAAQGGVVAAELARVGFDAARESLEGTFGYFNVYQRGEYNRSQLLDGLGEHYYSPEVTLKIYPCCMHTHAAIEALQEIKDQHGLIEADIARIQVGLNQQGFNFVGGASPDKTVPRTTPAAQFSIYYVLAACFATGRLTPAEFAPDSLARPEVMELARRVECRVDPVLQQEQPTGVSPALVRVETRDGRILEARARSRRGTPQNPLSWQEVVDKFLDCAQAAARPIAPERALRVVTLVERLESLSDASQILDPLG
ncbi:MAG: MmgE/PrpD family protein [Desulfarculaceae bacterium]|nr:MmgE/PrpD family protein [Desulfarculaceae bacterium]MCF8049174.1 MmgE/PrpD family protein [Desulfarculaceae bacterium]MCF8065419.1 MmgE/PrpD family protein [Desulfarculaceae bacterium]MCF8096708.1 MmgE/PrpD family protein [Desulfarculaceae bacterium]